MTARLSHHHRKSPRKSAIEALCLLAITAIGAPLLHAQRVAVATRVLPALAANAAVDAGQLPISQPLTLTVRLHPSALQTAALDQLLAAQTDPASPIYHQWLTPEEFAAQFGPTSDQLSAVTDWLQSQGLAYVAIVNAGLAATLSPSISVPYGATATATATVTLPGSSASPSGDVYAQIQGVTGAFYTATLSPNPGGNSATANIVLSIPSPGSYTVEVRCQGNQNFQCQTPVLMPIKTVKGYTNTNVTVNPAAPQAGEPIYITASVANAGNGTGTYTYGGSIGFYDSGKLIASAPVATNQATASASLSGVRTHYLTAVYRGDTNWNTSTSAAVSVLPTILPTALTVTTNTNGSNSLNGVNIIFTGSVTANTNFGTGPTGYVTFFDTYNGAVLPLGNGSAIVANGANASNVRLTTTGLLPGLHHIYAQYTGDDNYASATSAVTTLSISDFSVTMNPSTLTITRGQNGTATALIGATGGFTGNISPGCSPPGDSEATCSVSPASVPVGQSATISFLTVAPRTNRSTQRVNSVSGWRYATGATLASLFFFLAPRRRRSLPSLVLVLLAVSLTADLGCGLGTTIAAASGGGTGTNPSDPGTPLGTQNYIITAAGSDGVNSVRHTYQYQVTIQ